MGCIQPKNSGNPPLKNLKPQSLDNLNKSIINLSKNEPLFRKSQ